MSVAQYIARFARETPAATALICDGDSVSYRVFARAILKTGAEVSSCGIPSPGTVAVMARNLADCWVVTLALQTRGYTTICVTSMALLDALQVRDLTAIFIVRGEAGDALEHHRSVPVFTVSAPDFEDIALSDEEFTALAGISEECGHILYTSGTTGNYKMYLLTGPTQQARDRERIEYYKLDQASRFHALGFGLWTAIGYHLPPSVWAVGGCLILDQRDNWPRHFYDHSPSFAFLLPDMALQLCDEKNPLFSGVAGGSEPVLYACGGFFSRNLAQKLTANVSRKIVTTYGSSEINPAALDQVYRSPEDLIWMSLCGLRGVEVVDERGQACPVNEEGMLRVRRTELDVHEYLGDEVASAAAFRDGYFYPGDMAVQREDGRFRILGRVADVVNLGGRKLAVAPIEANLQRVLQVDYVCLFSGMDPAGETVVMIAMETDELPEGDRLDHVGREMSQWGEVRFARVSRFPRTQSTRKIDRKRLRELVFRNETGISPAPGP